jgi:hypothetical protein
MASGFITPNGLDLDDIFELAQSGKDTGRDAVVNHFTGGNDPSVSYSVTLTGGIFVLNQNILDRYMSSYENGGPGGQPFSLGVNMEIYGDVQVTNVGFPPPESLPYSGSGYVDLVYLLMPLNTYNPSLPPGSGGGIGGT